MKSAPVRFLVSLIASIIIALVHYSNIALPTDLIKPASFQSFSSFYEILNLSHNAFHPWRLNFFAARVADLFGIPVALLFQQLLFIAGTVWLIKILFPLSSILDSLSTALLFTTLLLALFGFDQVIISSLSLMPALIAVLIALANNTGENARKGYLFLLLLLSVLLSQSANQLTLIFCLIAFLVARQFSENKLSRRYLVLVCGVLFLLPAISSFLIPTASFPNYPLLARVVADDGLPGMIRPLVGADSPIPIVNRDFLRASYGVAASLFLIALFVCWVLVRNPRDIKGRKLFIFAAIMGFLLWLDVCLPEKFSLIMPLATISRLVPSGVFFIPLAPSILAFAVFFLLLALQLRSAILLQLLLVVAMGTYFYQSTSPFGSLQLAKREQAVFDLSQRKHSNPELAVYDDLLISPSYPIFNRIGFDILRSRRERSLPEYVPLSSLTEVHLSAADGFTEDLDNVRDGKRNTRWSAKTGKQSGNEWIHINLGKDYKVRGVEVNPGSFFTDFPRGIEVRYSRSCLNKPSAVTDFKAYRMVYQDKEWLGSVAFTAEGYPYYLVQSKVSLDFPKSVVAKCLLISQIAQHEVNDWSVADISLAIEPQ